LAVVLTLAFAAWLSRRIRRLSIAATTALSPEGRIEQRLPETAAHDELGDLARSFASLLHRINEYAAYLQTLGSKLSHEFRTPLAIVSSSLDNLSAQQEPGAANNAAMQKQFIDRARDGTARLQAILSAMTEATRVEQSIEQSEQVDFDLGDLVRSAATAYQQTFNTHRIDMQVPTAPCPMRGAPELIAQLLDKLVDNAVDFCPQQGQILIELDCEAKHYRLSVSNEGPLLPPDAEMKIFDMLVSNRTASGAKPHLGLGLYIVQLIARFHRGEVSARNLPDATGVAFDVRLMR
jgi:signal transduction histidine kinase